VDAEKVVEHDSRPKIVTFTMTTITVTTTITSPPFLDDETTLAGATKAPPLAHVKYWRVVRAKPFLTKLKKACQMSEAQCITSPNTQTFNPVLDPYRGSDLDTEIESDDDNNQKPPFKNNHLLLGPLIAMEVRSPISNY
jgi:hypothetical protein